MKTARPLKVVHVTFGLDVGGLEKLLLEIARNTQPSRFSLLFVSLGGPGPVGEELRKLGWPVVCLHRPSGFHPTIATQLYRIFRGVRADVVHTHDARALIYGAPAARLARVSRVIHTQHGQGLGLSGRQRWLLKAATRAVSRFVCVSRDARRIASELFGVPPHKLSTIYNGIDVERFMSDSYESARGPIVTVARLSPEKGISVLLQAMALARQETPEVRLEIAGEGPARDELRRECDALDLSDCVRFLGRVDDVPRLLQNARMFVLPSHSEGVALTLLEAMAAGVAVVATRVGGSTEVVVDDQTGVLIPPADPAAMARAICRLWSDADERDRLAGAAKLRVVELFHVDRMVRAYQQLYRGINKPEAALESPSRVELSAPVAP